MNNSMGEEGGRGYPGQPGQKGTFGGGEARIYFPTWLWAIVITVVIAALGGIYNLAISISNTARGDQITTVINNQQVIMNQLDRNCRIIAALDQDIRIHSLETKESIADIQPKNFAPFPDVSC